MIRSRHSFRLSSATLTLLLVSAAVNVLQARRIHALVEPVPIRSSIGHTASPIAGVALTGAAINVAVDSGIPTLVYYFNPSCGWCERNWGNLRTLAQSTRGQLRIVAVTDAPVESLGAFIRQRGLTFEVYGGVSRETRDAYGFAGTPHTVVVSSQGLISAEWAGAYTGQVATQVERLFGVVLPGLESPQKAAASPH